MAWEDTLIRLYLYIAEQHEDHLAPYAERFSNNQSTPAITDEEVLTVYLFGLIRGRRTLRALYDYTRDHLADYFPRLPSYGGYVQRLNRLGDLFPALIARVLAGYPGGELIEDVRLIDSIPIILAGERRSGQAKVAPELAKGLLRLEGDVLLRGEAPRLGPAAPWHDAGAGAARAHAGLGGCDLVAFRGIAGQLSGTELYADKAYAEAQMAEDLAQEQAAWASSRR